jgi:uroporphyrin-III C-methyltransferase/precorrin-2 dehydrogenase/sirohydrochlorin ferrochelatase
LGERGELDLLDNDSPAKAGAQFRAGGDWAPAFAGEARHVERLVLSSPDPDDLTLRQARLLANADRVTHGANVPAAILDRARADAARIETAAPPVDAPPGLTVDVRMRG